MNEGRGTLASIAGRFASLIGVLAAVVVLYVVPPHAAITLLDLQTIAVHCIVVGIAAAGMTMVIISGGIDLSVGSQIALTSVVAALAMKAGWPLWAAAVACVAAGSACGLYNGLLITVLRLPPFIATLGTLGFFRGVAKWVSESKPITAPTGGLERLVRQVPEQSWMVLVPGVWLLVGVCGVMAVRLRSTVLGRQAFAIGSNEEAAKRAGIKIGATKIKIYAIAGALAGIAGLMQFARVTQGDPTISVGQELDIIAAVVIGGASLSGGQGSVFGTLLGAFLMAYLRNRCTVLGWENYIQEMIVGHIIILAVAVDQWRRRKGR